MSYTLEQRRPRDLGGASVVRPCLEREVAQRQGRSSVAAPPNSSSLAAIRSGPRRRFRPACGLDFSALAPRTPSSARSRRTAAAVASVRSEAVRPSRPSRKSGVRTSASCTWAGRPRIHAHRCQTRVSCWTLVLPRESVGSRLLVCAPLYVPSDSEKLEHAPYRGEVAATFRFARGHRTSEPRAGEVAGRGQTIVRRNPLGFGDPFLVRALLVAVVRYRVDESSLAPPTPPTSHEEIATCFRLRNDGPWCRNLFDQPDDVLHMYPFVRHDQIGSRILRKPTGIRGHGLEAATSRSGPIAICEVRFRIMATGEHQTVPKGAPAARVPCVLTDYTDHAMAGAVDDKHDDGTFEERVRACRGVVAFDLSLTGSCAPPSTTTGWCWA